MIKYDSLTKFSSEAEYKAAKEQLPYPQVSISNNENKINFEPHYPADGKLAVLKQDRVNWTDEDIDFLQNNIARFDPSLEITLEDITKSQAAYDKWEQWEDKTNTGDVFDRGDFKYAPKIDTSKVMSMSGMFNFCVLLTVIPQLDTNSVTDMESMFRSCFSLTAIPQLDTSKVTDMYFMFHSCEKLTTIPQLDTSKVTNMESMFSTCRSLTNIPLLDTSKVTNMKDMFRYCSSLTTIPLLDTSKVTNMTAMFHSCEKLITIPKLDVSNVISMSWPFSGCISLTTLGGFTGLKTDLNFTWDFPSVGSCPLTRQSMLNVFNEAADVKAEPKTLTLGQVNLDKLTPEDKKIAIDKGWVLA